MNRPPRYTPQKPRTKSQPKPETPVEQPPAVRGPVDHRERLQKVLAAAGHGSRRACEDFITQGRVTINGRVAKLGETVDPEQQEVKLDGERVKVQRKVYWFLNKPAGVISTNADTHGRTTIVDLLPDIGKRVYSVGRLDEDSTGLMLLTNDGDLAHQLTHPSFGVPKTYIALIAGKVGDGELGRMQQGMYLAEGKARPKSVRRVGAKGDATQVEIVLSEGRNREVRRLFAAVGHKVMKLERMAIGPVKLRKLRPGESRPASQEELKLLREAITHPLRRRSPVVATGPRGPRLGKPDPRLIQAARPPQRPAGRGAGSDRPQMDRPGTHRPAVDRPGKRPGLKRPGSKRPEGPPNARTSTAPRVGRKGPPRPNTGKRNAKP